MLLALLATMFGTGWQVTEAVDPISDRVKVTARLDTDNAAIFFTCAKGEWPALSYQPQEFLGGAGLTFDVRSFIYRFDGRPAKRVGWRYFDRYATPVGRQAAVAFVTEMIKAKTLVIRAERYDHYLIDSSFRLDGAPQAFHQAFNACGIGG